MTVPIYLYPVIPSKSFKEKQSVFPSVLFYKRLCLRKRPISESVWNSKVTGSPVTVTREAKVHLQREPNSADDREVSTVIYSRRPKGLLLNKDGKENLSTPLWAYRNVLHKKSW